VYEQTIDFGKVIQSELPRHLLGHVSNVNVVTARNDGVQDSDLSIRIEIENVGAKVERALGDHPGAASISFSIVAEIAGKEAWRKRYALKRDYLVPKGSAKGLMQITEATLIALFSDGLKGAVENVFQDARIRSELASHATEQRQSVEAVLQQLSPINAIYRVTAADATLRKMPNPKAGAIRQLGFGSQLQIIGQLPTGWLQVAKEGEAIGWIHEGSVQAMSVQSQPAVAVAATPTRPAPVAVSPAPTLAAAPAANVFPTKPVAVSFPRAKPAPDDIAVIIGNANYKATAKDIPDVVPAYADAEGMKRYAVQALGIKEENVIFIKDAKLIDLISTFGTADDPKGKLFNWVKPGQSNVFVFYSGHGAPSADGTSSYLVPVDAQAALINLSGYSLKALYANLGKLPAKSVTVVLEACFSGASQSGMLVKNASPIYQKAMAEIVPTNLTVISAGSGNQIASWEQDKSHGLFTKHYLLGMAGAADRKPYGNGDGKVSTDELTAYLKGTMSYMAQRYYGREQTVQVATGAGR
jgi:hypothetical protein